MDFAQAASRWNRAISAKSPTASALVSFLGTKPQLVFGDVPDILYLGGNLLLKLPPATEYCEGVPALSISLILKEGLFPNNALIRTENVPRFAFLGTTFPCSGQTMLEHLTKADAKHVSASTEQDRWTIYYGEALSLLFLPLEQAATGPAGSELAMIEFFYSMPFRGQVSPHVEEVSAASAP